MGTCLIRSINKGVPAKRAYKLTCEFVNSFSYPVEKFQDGKHQRFRIRDKTQLPMPVPIHMPTTTTTTVSKKTTAPEENEIIAETSKTEMTDAANPPAVEQPSNVRKRESKLEQVSLYHSYYFKKNYCILTYY